MVELVILIYLGSCVLSFITLAIVIEVEKLPRSLYLPMTGIALIWPVWVLWYLFDVLRRSRSSMAER